MKLVGEINYPNVEINPVDINLYCISNYAADYKEIILKNVSTLPVKYHWEWQEELFEEEPLNQASVSIKEWTVKKSKNSFVNYFR